MPLNNSGVIILKTYPGSSSQIQLMGGASDLSVTQPAQVVQQLRLGLEVSTYISRPELGFRYLLPGVQINRDMT